VQNSLCLRHEVFYSEFSTSVIIPAKLYIEQKASSHDFFTGEQKGEERRLHNQAGKPALYVAMRQDVGATGQNPQLGRRLRKDGASPLKTTLMSMLQSRYELFLAGEC
jgi:hypothetical protein